MPGPVVETRALAKRFGERQAVVDLSFRVEAGECVGLLGPNGAGQDDDHPDAHRLRGADRRRGLASSGCRSVPRPPRRSRRRLGIVSQEDSLDPDLSVEKNLLVYASYFGIPSARGRAAHRRADRVRGARRSPPRAHQDALRRHEAPSDAGARAAERAPRCSSSTSRPPASTRRRGGWSGSASARSSAAAPPSC